MPNTIAFDFDGVIADTSTLKREWFLSHVGIKINDVDRTNAFKELSKYFPIDEVANIYHKMSKDVFTEKMLLKTDLVDENIPLILEKLCEEYQLIIITQRPLFMLEWVKKWLSDKKIDSYFSKILSSSNKAKDVIALDNNATILIDDDIRHLENSRVQNNILYNSNSISNWEQLYKKINSMKRLSKS